MNFDSQRAQDLLQELKLGSLFVSGLGWSPPQGISAIATRFLKQPYRCRCVAQRESTTVWEIKVSSDVQLTPQIRERLYQTIGKKYAQPLLIFTEASRTRSLWHWQQRLGEQRVAQSVVFIAGQPDVFWQTRLEKIWAYAPGSGGLSLLPDWPANLADLMATFEQQVRLLYSAIEGISNAADRWRYAGLLLTRLIVVFELQQRGLLNQGDTWYLHTRFGQSQQQGQNLFFQQILQPLFAQGFALPEIERPQLIVERLGKLPFLGSLFESALDQQYPDARVPDAPFESILIWFGEPVWGAMLNPWRSAALQAVFEQHILGQTEGGYPSHPLLVEQCCDRTLVQYILQQLGVIARATVPSLNDRLFQADVGLCRQLIQEVLPQLHILDPACGAGTFLMASLQWLVELYSVLMGHLRQTQDAQLGIWLSALLAERPSLIQGIYRRLLQNTLHGVDRSAAAIDIAQLQLMMSLCATATDPMDLEALPTLDFNLLIGNSLVGLIRVDEQGFDRIKARGLAEGVDAFQGNLLQPLVADSYRTILAEKNITLEHYKSQTSLLEELQGIPQYAQMAFLRDSLNQLNHKAESKLNALLLNQFSQKLGIQYRETQLTERPRPRLLRVEDLELLHPFHWGYFFASLLEQQEGFSVIISAPPWGVFRPTPDGFFAHFQDMAIRKGVDGPSLKTSKQALLAEDPELAEAWLFYQSQYSFVTDYFNRAEQYSHQRPPGQRSSLRLDWLFAEQCFNLLSPQGICALVMPCELAQSEKGEVLRALLARGGQFYASAPLPKALLPTAPKSAKLPPFCLVCFGKNEQGF